MPGWNLVQGPSRSMAVAEAVPVESGNVVAVYAWDAEEGRWRCWLPGVGIPELNTLDQLRVDQAVWVLASKRFQVSLPV